jgi:bifunctional DNA-binding transcriptional regulator/antitoxin component of YhaV-PrlF toxin-antitoxin module
VTFMGETTTLTLAATKKASLRTTVPMSIVKQFGLQAGDKLDWAFSIKDGQMVIIVNPIKIKILSDT